MKWESAPLWPVALPSIIGCLLSFIPYLFEIEYFSKKNLLAPILVLGILGICCFLLPDRYGNKIELYLGYTLTLLLSFSFRFLFGFYGIVVVFLVWLSQSIYIWQYNYPPFRIGIWLALGAMSGLYVGGILAYNLL
ncbi:hypothetical protein OAV45_02650 [Candidatus Poseidoniales archaeon]|jgi:hypothetical protein|nr:hypothetical protein [Euryarchaeota archaeon]MDC3310306.1 hypothetical protein [Candidatus Poseidoniales archaeon]MDG1542682.1 hypothetical protein [Candidatus Thalassarchaeaceae archaeon]|tara:strand:- start:1416 stop:1823 length:408 start_codon:yes stop_codon:yes gene_type:complete